MGTSNLILCDGRIPFDFLTSLFVNKRVELHIFRWVSGIRDSEYLWTIFSSSKLLFLISSISSPSSQLGGGKDIKGRILSSFSEGESFLRFRVKLGPTLSHIFVIFMFVWAEEVEIDGGTMVIGEGGGRDMAFVLLGLRKSERWEESSEREGEREDDETLKSESNPSPSVSLSVKS